MKKSNNRWKEAKGSTKEKWINFKQIRKTYQNGITRKNRDLPCRKETKAQKECEYLWMWDHRRESPLPAKSCKIEPKKTKWKQSRVELVLAIDIEFI